MVPCGSAHPTHLDIQRQGAGVFRQFRFTLLILAAPVVAAPVPAQGQPPLRFVHGSAAIQDLQPEAGGADALQPAESLTNWHVQVELMARYTAPAGEIRLPGGSVRGSLVDLEDLDVNGPRLMPGFDISLRKDEWRLNAIGLFYDIDDRVATADEDIQLGQVFVARGQRSNVSHTYAQLDFRLAHTILDEPISEITDSRGHKVRFRLDVEVGLRIYDFEFEVANLDTGDGPYTDDRTFFEPHAGFKAAFNIWEQVTVDLYTNFGAWPFDAKAYSWDIGVGFQWRPVDYVGVQIGYRSTIFRLNEGSGASEFEWNGSYQGLHAGIQIRF
jgi:hypothetical protein